MSYLTLQLIAKMSLNNSKEISYVLCRILSMSGLFFIAMGTGGIKPCVSSFGGDQFSVDQVGYLSMCYRVFYRNVFCMSR